MHFCRSKWSPALRALGTLLPLHPRPNPVLQEPHLDLAWTLGEVDTPSLKSSGAGEKTQCRGLNHVKLYSAFLNHSISPFFLCYCFSLFPLVLPSSPSGILLSPHPLPQVLSICFPFPWITVFNFINCFSNPPLPTASDCKYMWKEIWSEDHSQHWVVCCILRCQSLYLQQQL